MGIYFTGNTVRGVNTGENIDIGIVSFDSNGVLQLGHPSVPLRLLGVTIDFPTYTAFNNVLIGSLDVTTITGGTVFTTGTDALGNMNPWIDQTGTWNNAAITFTGFKSNITDTASGASSLLFDLQVNGVTKFNIQKSGVVNTSWIEMTNTGVYSFGGRTRIKSSADGILNLLNAAETDFTRLNFGGVTSSFPSIGRTGTGFVIQLADGSAGGTLAIGGAAVASCILTLTSVLGAVMFPRMTTTQRDALTAASGMVVYNTTTGKLNVRGAAAWEAVTSV